jgi:predicted RNA polymerase sigma factor
MEEGDHLFRREAGRMVAALTRIFGIHNLALAEDVVQDAFCRALEVWKFRGVPENPAAWLTRFFAVANLRAGAGSPSGERMDSRAGHRGALRSPGHPGR